MEDNRKKLYDNLSADYDMGDYADYNAMMDDDARRKKFYDQIVSDGYDMPDYNQFSADMGVNTLPQQQAPAQNTDNQVQSNTQPQQDNRQKQTAAAEAQDKKPNAALESYKQYVMGEKKKAADTHVRVVPDNPNIVAAIVTDDLAQQNPDLDAYRGELVYVNKQTGKPIMETKNEAGEYVQPDIKRAGDTSNEVHKEPAALMLDDVHNVSLRIPQGQLDKEVDNYIKQTYGDQWNDKNVVFKDDNGNPLSRDEIRAEMKQELYDQYNKGMQALRNSLMFQDDEAKKQVITQMKEEGTLPEWLDDKTALQYVGNVTDGEKSVVVSRMLIELQRRLKDAKARFAKSSKEVAKKVGDNVNQAQQATVIQMHPTYTTDQENVTKLEQQIADLEAVRDQLNGNMGLGNQLKHALKTSGFFDPNTWLFNQRDIQNMPAYLKLNEKIHRGEKLTENEAALLQTVATDNNVGSAKSGEMSDSYKILEGVAMSMPFTATFLLGGEMSSGIAKGVGQGVRQAVKRTILNTMGKGATKAAIKTAEKASEYLVTKALGVTTKVLTEGLAMSTTMGAGKTLSDAAHRTLKVEDDGEGDLKHKGVGYGAALAQALTDNTIENASEYAGEYLALTPFMQTISKSKLGGIKGVRDFTAWLLKSGRTDFVRDFNAIRARMGMHGMIGEWNEENIGTLTRGIIGLDDAKVSDLFDAENQKQTIGTVVLQSLVTGMAATAVTGAQTYAVNYPQLAFYTHNLDKWAERGELLFGDSWTNIQSRIDLATNDRIADIVTEYTNDENLAGAQKQAVVNYAANLVKQRGVNLAAKKMESIGLAEDQWTIRKRQAYLEGYNAEGNAKHQAQTDLQGKETVLADLLGGETINLDESSDKALLDMGESRPELKQAIRDYLDARDRYKGVISRASHDVQDAVADASDEADKRTDKKRGKVRSAMRKGVNGAEDYEVFIVDGNVAMNDDGTIDVGNSDNMILFYDPTTNKTENGDATSFASVNAEQDAQDYKVTRVSEAKKAAIGAASQSIDYASVEEGKAETVQAPQQAPSTPVESATPQAEEVQQAQESVDSFPYEEIIDNDGEVVPASVKGVDENASAFVTGIIGKARGKSSDLFAITVVDEAGNVKHTKARRGDIVFGNAVSLDGYKQTLGAAAQEIATEDVPAESAAEQAVQPEQTSASQEDNKPVAEAERTAKETEPQPSGMTFEDGTPVPMTEDGKAPDFSRMSAAQSAELYDNTFGEQAEELIGKNLAKAESAVAEAQKMEVEGDTWAEQVESKNKRDAAMKEAQDAYDRASVVSEEYIKRMKAKTESEAGPTTDNAEETDDDADKFSRKRKHKNSGKGKSNQQPRRKTYKDADGNWNTRQLIDDTAVSEDAISEDLMPESLKKALGKIAKVLGVRIQYLNLASVDTDGDMPNGWYSSKDNGEGYENGTIYLSNNPARAVEFIFGHEMTHEIRKSNPEAYNRLKAMARSVMGGAIFSQRLTRAYAMYEGVKGYNTDEDYEEEVVADFIGMMVNDGDMLESIVQSLDHPVLAALSRAIGKVKQWFTGDYYGKAMDNMQNTIERAINDAAVEEYEDDATKEEDGTQFSLRTRPAPKKTKKVYKLMRLGEDGKLYPLFIGNAEAIELREWYDADSPTLRDLKSLSSREYVGTRTVTKNGEDAREQYNYGAYLVNNETGEAISLAEFKKKVKGNKAYSYMKNNPNVVAINWATNNGYRWIKIEEKNNGQSRYDGEARSYYNYGINGSGSVGIFAMRPGWHAGSLPTMRQIGKGHDKNLRDDSFVWVEGYIPADIDYNEEAQSNADKDIPDHIPTDGFYLKATNANKEASQADKVGWYVAGAFRPMRIMSDKEARDVIDDWNKKHPNEEPVEYDWKRESGKEFNADTMSLEDVDKFSLNTDEVYSGNADVLTQEEVGSRLAEEVEGYVPQAVPWNRGVLYDGNDSPVKYSAKSAIVGVSLRPVVEADGKLKIVDSLGRKFDKSNLITAEDLKRTDSVLNAMVNICTDNGTLKNADAIYIKYADFLNRLLEKGEKGFGYVTDQWMWEGEALYRSVHNNGDAQYAKSIDITRICKKNEAVIHTISELQKRQGYGVTVGQILDIYNQTVKDGYQAPCPVCYVFSRYLRNGVFASTLVAGQRRYGNVLVDPKSLTEQEKKKRVDYWLSELAQLEKFYGENKKAISQAKQDIQSIFEQVDDIAKGITGGKLKGKELKEAKRKIKELDARYRAAIDLVSVSDLTGYIKAMAIEKKGDQWKLRTDSWKLYPEDVALDITRAQEAIVEYPGVQRYRNSHGSAAGKSIQTASNNDLGDTMVALGLGNPEQRDKRSKQLSHQNILLKAFADETTNAQRIKLLNMARKDIKRATVYAAQQLLRGGIRQWSWSDNVERLSPDVFLNLMQVGMIGGALQAYSKQLEGVELVASMGGYINGSLMGKGRGYIEVSKDYKDGPVYYNVADGKYYTLMFDNVVGIEPFSHDGKLGLFDLNKMYDRAGNILVGMDDIHVRTAMADPRVFFIIPWHASGMTNHILNQFYNYLGVDTKELIAQDYTKTQEEKKYGADENVPQEVTDYWESHNYQDKYKSGIGNIPSGKGRLSAQQIHYRELKDALLLHNSLVLKKPKSAIRSKKDIVDYEFWTAHKDWLEEIQNDEFLSLVLDKVRNTVNVLGESMTKGDTGYIYPYEYWDANSTIDNADVNGERYIEYCRRLGMRPKFCGITNDGVAEFGGFSDDPGYWKLLVDRRMYDRNGNFQDLTPVSVGGFEVDMVDPEKTKERFDVTRVAELDKISEVVDHVQEMEEQRGIVPEVNYEQPLDEAVKRYDGARFSLKQIIDEAKRNGTYMKAPNGKPSNLNERQWAQVRTKAFKDWFGDWENDPENASKVVDENGEPRVVYHQTNSTVWINRETGENYEDLDWQAKDYWQNEASDEEWEDAWEEQDFYTFDNTKHGRRSVEMPAFFFAPEYDEYHEYGDRTVAAFLNIKNPAINPTIEDAGVYNDAGEKAMQKLIDAGHDGFIREYDGKIEEINAFYPNQIKSATENTGTFDKNNDDIRFSLNYNQFQKDMEQWLRRNHLPEHAQRPTPPQRQPNETTAQFAARVNKFLAEDALWQTAPTYEGHLLADGTAMGEYNRELQRNSVLARITLQDSMLPIRKAQEAIAKECGLYRVGIFEDAYLAENRSHGMAKNQMEQFNTFFLEPLREAYHDLSERLGGYDKVKVYMMAKHGLERNRMIAFRDALAEDYEDDADRDAQYNAYMTDPDRLDNDYDYISRQIDFQTYIKEDDRIRGQYAPSYERHRYDEHGLVKDYAGLSALFPTTPDFEVAADNMVGEAERDNKPDTDTLWMAVNDATKKILRSSLEAGMMTQQNYDYVSHMYRFYIPLRGWEETNADQVWDYVKGGKGNNSQTLKSAHGRKSIADDPVATITQMAESGFIINNKNIVKQHLLRCAQNHPTSLLSVSKAWYVKTKDLAGNTVWQPASPNIPVDETDPAVIKKALEDFETNMELLEQSGDARTQRERLNIEYPQDNGEKREHEIRVMVDGKEMVIYVNGDPQLAQAINNSRVSRVRQGIQESKFESAVAKVGRFQASVYTSLSPMFIPSNFFRDLTMVSASTAIREDARYNAILYKNLASTWGTMKYVMEYESGKLKRKIDDGKASKTEGMFYDYMMLGGETGFVSSTDIESYKQRLQEKMKDMNRSAVNPKKVWSTFMESIETVNRAIEASNRFMIYKTSVEYGRSKEQAINDAKDVTLNFNRKGTGEHGWQTVRNMYLFINPAIQSLQTLGTLAKKHPLKFGVVTAMWMASGLLIPALNAMMLEWWGDDDDKDKYWRFTKWDRRNNLILWVPGTKNFIKIPLSQEFRGFYGLGDMVANMCMAPEEYKQTWEDYATDTMGQIIDLLPIDPTGYNGNVMLSLAPNAIRPLFELAFNVDFTGKPIFKNSDNNKYDPNFTKAYAGTPHLLTMFSKWANSIGNDFPDVQQNSIDSWIDPRFNPTNPAVLDHLLKGYLGGAYSTLMGISSAIVKGIDDAENFTVADVPILSKFMANPDDRPVSQRQGDEFWELKDEQDRTANTLRNLKKKAKEDGDFSDLERFYGTDDYKNYKANEPRMRQYEEDRKKEKVKEAGEEDIYKPKKKTYTDVYKKHTTPADDFEDMKMDMLWKKVKAYKDAYDLLEETVSQHQSDEYYKKHKDAIDTAEDVAGQRKEITELKKGFLDEDGETYDADDMDEIRSIRKDILKSLDEVNKKIVKDKDNK